VIGSGRDDALGDVFVSTPPGYLYSSTLTRFDDLHLPYNVTYEKLSKTTRQTRVLPSTFGSWLRGCNAGDGEPFLFKNILAHPFYLFGTFSGPVKTWQHQNYFLFNCALLLLFFSSRYLYVLPWIVHQFRRRKFSIACSFNFLTVSCKTHWKSH